MRVAVILEQQANELGALYTTYRLLEEGHDVRVLTRDGSPRLAGHSGMALDRFLTVAGSIAAVSADEIEAVLCPGGFSADKLRALPEAKALIRSVHARGGLVAHLGHGAWVTLSAGVLKGRRSTSPPQIREDLENAGVQWVDAPVVVDGNLISGSGTDYGAFFRAVMSRLATS
jgi:protease I